MAKSGKTTIRKIEVKELFGLYNYNVPDKKNDKNIETAMILYGNNGSGKTTILRLIFHALGCERRAGHKTFIAKTKFRELVLRFNNDSEIQIKRDGENLIGTFEMCILKEGDYVPTTVEGWWRS